MAMAASSAAASLLTFNTNNNNSSYALSSSSTSSFDPARQGSSASANSLSLHSRFLLPAGSPASLWSTLPSSSFHPKCRRGTELLSRMMLPSVNPERKLHPNRPKWSARAIKSFSMAELEARKLKYPNTGTEALLMGILTEGTSQAARYLRAIGITLFGVRDETVKLIGKADMYFFSPEHPPLTEPSQKALDWAVEEKNKSGDDGEVTATHLLLGIWAQKGSAGQQVLAILGFDDKKAKDLDETIRQPLAIG